MKNLALVLVLLPTALPAQDTTAFRIYKSLEREQEEIRQNFLETLHAYRYGTVDGRDVAHDFAPFLETTIEKYRVVEMNPEVLIMDMDGMETIRLLKESTSDTLDAHIRMNELLKGLSSKAGEMRLEFSRYLAEITSH